MWRSASRWHWSSRRPGFEAYNLSAREADDRAADPRRRSRATSRTTRSCPKAGASTTRCICYGKAREHFGWEPKWNYLDLFREKFDRDPQPGAA